jgi:uncharacterized protein (DUF2147 family)
MKKKALMSIVLLAFVTAGTVFAQSPTLDKLNFVARKSGNQNWYEAQAANTSISGAVVIPATYNNLSVTGIQSGAFRNCINITSVTIPASVTGIGTTAFFTCSNLTSVTFVGSNTSFSARGVSSDSFPAAKDLNDKYQAGGAGTYTRPAGGTVWTKQAAASAPAPNTSLEGSWRVQPSGNIIINISGNTAVFSYYNPTGTLGKSATDKGYIKVGDQAFRNLSSTGNLTWSGQVLRVTYNTRTPDVATGTTWDNLTITMDPSGITFTDSTGSTYIRAGIQ